MNTPTITPPELFQVNLPAAEQRVLDACKAARAAEIDYTNLAVTAGFLLIEHRLSLMTSHDGKSSHWHDKTKPEQDQFGAWLRTHNIAKTTAYRWMEAAERVARLQLKLPTERPFLPAIDVDGVNIPLSQALTAPEQELPQQALEFRQGVFDFLSDRTISEAIKAAVDGESPAHRITRAGAGKQHGGAPDVADDPEARKKFPFYAGRAMADALTHIGARLTTGTGRRQTSQGGHWPNLTEEQKQEARDYAALFIGGLDDDLVQYLAEVARRELSDRKKGKRPEPLALRAIVDKAQARRSKQ